MTKIQTRQYQRKFPSTIRKTLHRRRVEPPALGDSTMQCGGVSMQLRLVFGGYHQKTVGSTLRFIAMMESIAASVGLVDTTKKRWDPPYDILIAAYDFAIDVGWNRLLLAIPPCCGFGCLGGYHQKAVGSTLRFIVMMESIAASAGLVDTTKKRWDPPYDILIAAYDFAIDVGWNRLLLAIPPCCGFGCLGGYHQKAVGPTLR